MLASYYKCRSKFLVRPLTSRLFPWLSRTSSPFVRGSKIFRLGRVRSRSNGVRVERQSSRQGIIFVTRFAAVIFPITSSLESAYVEELIRSRNFVRLNGSDIQQVYRFMSPRPSSFIYYSDYVDIKDVYLSKFEVKHQQSVGGVSVSALRLHGATPSRL